MRSTISLILPKKYASVYKYSLMFFLQKSDYECLWMTHENFIFIQVFQASFLEHAQCKQLLKIVRWVILAWKIISGCWMNEWMNGFRSMFIYTSSQTSCGKRWKMLDSVVHRRMFVYIKACIRIKSFSEEVFVERVFKPISTCILFISMYICSKVYQEKQFPQN